MYLRLHDEREERLKMLTQNISSAHANKPKGRRASPAAHFFVLQTSKKRALRIVCKTTHRKSTDPLFFKINALKFKDLVNLKTI